MSTPLTIEQFLSQAGAIIDVRSPSEYQQGHIPGSHSLPLFSDAERAQVGTAYKQQDRATAINLGLQIVGPKLLSLVQSATAHMSQGSVKILCWRGGMRSAFVGNLLHSLGFCVWTLKGGYKAFRQWTLQILENIFAPHLHVLGGLTGSGKTSILHSLSQIGEQVINLEGLANHRGSAFGLLGLSPQPSQEHFENQLAFKWQRLDLSRPIWIEDESRMIGKCRLPTTLHTLMSTSKLLYLDIAQAKRVEHILHIYGQMPCELLIDATKCISKRLGGQTTNQIIDLLQRRQNAHAFTLLLNYYDRTYHYYLSKRHSFYSIQDLNLDYSEWALYLRKLIQEIN
jgi:tRNA 2-selenouridine synthase